MPDILHDFPIFTPIDRVFAAVSEPGGLDLWWTKSSSGTPSNGATYDLDFGPGYAWKAVIRTFDPPSDIEYELVEATDDWAGTRVGFRLETDDGSTRVRFRHTGWAAETDHLRTSSFCWAMYLRILKRHLEHGETVAYEYRLEV